MTAALSSCCKFLIHCFFFPLAPPDSGYDGFPSYGLNAFFPLTLFFPFIFSVKCLNVSITQLCNRILPTPTSVTFNVQANYIFVFLSANQKGAPIPLKQLPGP